MDEMIWLLEKLREGFAGMRAAMLSFAPRRDEEDATLEMWVGAIAVSGLTFTDDQGGHERIARAFAELIARRSDWPKPVHFLERYRVQAAPPPPYVAHGGASAISAVSAVNQPPSTQSVLRKDARPTAEECEAAEIAKAEQKRMSRERLRSVAAQMRERGIPWPTRAVPPDPTPQKPARPARQPSPEFRSFMEKSAGDENR